VSLAFRILGSGLFPKELPRSFTSLRAASVLRKLGPTPFPARSSAALLRHSLARAGGVRRILGIPNPVPYFALATKIAAHWKLIKRTCNRSPWSLSGPRLSKTEGRAIAPRVALGDLNERRARARGLGRYLLSVDLTEYYRSVYTHSIPWALHTKAVAKASKGKAGLPGDELDQAVRRCQLDETMGLPVGPDASFVIGEMLLAAIDTAICKHISPRSGIRYYDDYEFTFATLRTAEEALATVQSTFSDYHLLANHSKTRIHDLPREIDTRWTAELSRFDVTRGPGLSHRLIRFFDTVTEYRRQTLDSQVVGYAIARFDDLRLLRNYDQRTWNLIQNSLLHLTVNEPSAIVALIRLFAKVHIEPLGLKIDLDQVGAALNEIIRFSAPLGHGSEVSWALWGLIAFGLKLNRAASSEVSGMRDSLVALLALDADSRRLVDGGLNANSWSKYASVDELYGDQWLLAYEAPLHGWIGSPTHISSDPNFAVLEKSKVRFYTKFKRLTRKVVEELDLWSSGYDEDSEDDDDDDGDALDLDDDGDDDDV
jgi:hypothetical protein